MRKTLSLILALSLLAAIFSGCSEVEISELDSRLSQILKQSYRSSSLVVRGEVVSVSPASNSLYAVEINVKERLAGSYPIQSGNIFAMCGACNVGDSYIFFLQMDQEAFESLANFAPSNLGTPTPSASQGDGTAEAFYSAIAYCQVTDDYVLIDGVAVSTSAALAYLNALMADIQLPVHAYYHSSLESLFSGCDRVFIGRVESLPDLVSTRCYSQDSGISIENEVETSNVTISVYGSIKGYIPYGTLVEMVYVPSMLSGMLDGASLSAVSIDASAIPELEAGEIYMFFMTDSPDSKRDYMFPVNPIQGFVHVEGDKLTPSQENTCMLTCTTLTLFASAIGQIDING